MSSLIANKLKTNMCLVPLSLYCIRYLCVPLFPTYIKITITACSIFFELNYSLFCSQRRFSKCNFTQGRLNSYCLSSALSCPFIVQHIQSNKRSWIRRFAFSPSRELYRDRLYMCILKLVCSFFPMLAVIGLLWSCSMYLFVYILFTLLVVYLLHI